jgi:hypothetical protein
MRMHSYCRAVSVLIAVVLIMCPAIAIAEQGPPVTQLPTDIGKLAIAWVAIPVSMLRMVREDGPVAGVTMGPIEGSGHMVQDSVTYLTSGYFYDELPSESSRPIGALLYYTF